MFKQKVDNTDVLHLHLFWRIIFICSPHRCKRQSPVVFSLDCCCNYHPPLCLSVVVRSLLGLVEAPGRPRLQQQQQHPWPSTKLLLLSWCVLSAEAFSFSLIGRSSLQAIFWAHNKDFWSRLKAETIAHKLPEFMPIYVCNRRLNTGKTLHS